MPDAPVQAIQLDPNLLVNASNAGLAAGFNYGTGAQGLRAAQTDEIIARTDFSYGAGAIDSRTASTNETTARSNFSYGTGALNQQQAQTNQIDAQTAYTLIANEGNQLTNQIRADENAKVLQYDRQNRGISKQHELAINQETALFHASDAGKKQIHDLAIAGVTKETNEVALAAETSKSQLENAYVENQTKYKDILRGNLAATNETDRVFNKQAVINSFLVAKKADMATRMRTGIGNPTAQIEVLGSIAQSNYKGFDDAAEEIGGYIDELAQTTGLSPQQKSMIDEVRNVSTHYRSRRAMSSTLTNLVGARAQGNIAAADNTVLTTAASIGINPATDAEQLSIEKVGKDYVVTNTGTQKSEPLPAGQFAASEAWQTLFVNSEKRKATSNNVATKADNTAQTMADIAKTPLTGPSGERLQAITESLSGQLNDIGQFQKQGAQTLNRMDQSIAMANPFNSPKEAEVLNDLLDIGDSNLNKFFSRKAKPGTDPLGITDESATFENYISKNPNTAVRLVKAYVNRERLGLSSNVFTDYVEEMAKTAERSNPSMYMSNPNLSPLSIAENRQTLRSNIQSGLVLNTNSKQLKTAYDRIVKVRPDLIPFDLGRDVRVPPLTLLGKIKASVRENVIGTSIEHLQDPAIVPQEQTTPVFPLVK